MVTASHNPPQYNGYKVYWKDGAQVVFPHDEGIIGEVRKVHSPEQVRLAPPQGRINGDGEEPAGVVSGE